MTISKPFKPTKQQLIDAAGQTLPDVIAPNLRVLFCGINPGLYTAAVGHHFARPGNRFWPALHGSGFTPRLLTPYEDGELPRHRLRNPSGLNAHYKPADFARLYGETRRYASSLE